MIYFVITLFFQLASLCADSPPASISSKNASYNGNKLFLEGDVKLDHEFGQMSAATAYLEKDDKLKDFLFSMINLQKDVFINLKNHGQVLCEVADLNFQTLKGKFFPKLGEKITYMELLEKVKGGQALLKLNSALAEIKISKKGADYHIEEIEALQDVLIEYAQDFSLQAERAIFQGNGQKPIISAYPEEGSYCVLSHLGDRVQAKVIEFDLKNFHLTLKEAHGTLASILFPQVQKDEIRFKAGELIWDHPQGMLKLKGGAFIQEGSFASLQTDEEIELKQVVQNKKRKLKSIVSCGHTLLQYTDPESECKHQLSCQGPILVDRETLHAVLESPKLDGNVAEEMQIAYEQDSMVIRANRADVQYKTEEKGILLSSLSLEGNVRLSVIKPNLPSKLAVADKVVLSPSDHMIVLTAAPGKKVLFWDEQEQLAISANQVKMIRDPLTGKDSVKGVGNVRFSFDSVEQTTLKKIFPFYELPTGESNEKI
jgi:lipopolysaccharide export system protein LptA